MINNNQPLAYRLRPEYLKEFVGQEHLVGEGKPLKIMLSKPDGISSSIILWGPPGSGKTTIARLIAKITNSEFIEMSAVRVGKQDINKAINKSRLLNKKVILFLDEIHRFNKAQQDFLLPYVEDGTITLIGATTENPSFEIISALLSRSRVFTLYQLQEKDIMKIINRALESEKGLNKKYQISEENKKLISQLSNGDARDALNIIEMSASLTPEENKRPGEGIEITKETIQNSVQRFLKYDKQGEEHYNIISAMHKSLRDSDIQASIYWTMRMVEAGEDPKYIIRRLVRFASEDIGNADPEALKLAIAAKDSVEFLGYPECNTALVQTAIYLAQAEKSNKVYEAVNTAKDIIRKTGNLPVPFHLRNPETNLMKDIGYGDGYKYAHDYEDPVEAGKSQQDLPDELDEKNTNFYTPTNRGFEKKIKEKLDEYENKG